MHQDKSIDIRRHLVQDVDDFDVLAISAVWGLTEVAEVVVLELLERASIALGVLDGDLADKVGLFELRWEGGCLQYAAFKRSIALRGCASRRFAILLRTEVAGDLDT